MVEIAKKYLADLRIINTQYSITKHTDKAHLHLHIIANMVDNEGQAIRDNWIGLRAKKAAQQLTVQYNLVQAFEKNLALTNLEALGQSEANKYKIYMAISKSLPHCQSIEDLSDCLLKHGIDTVIKYKGPTKEKQGISFKCQNDCFKGSKIDRKFSLGNLEKILAVRQKPALNQKRQLCASDLFDGTTPQSQSKDLTEDLTKSISKAIDLLLRPEPIYESQPHELMTEKKRKKRKLSQRIHNS